MYTTVIETGLLLKIKQDPSLFAEVFRLYNKSILGFIFRRSGDFNEALDIAAETFSKAYQLINRFEDRGIPIKIWLYRIACNEINLYHRRLKKHRAVFKQLSGHEVLQGFIQDDRAMLEQELLKHQQYLTVLQQVKTLPVKYQEVLALRYFEGKDNTEIATILDLNEGTLKSLLSRGLEKLRQKCNRC